MTTKSNWQQIQQRGVIQPKIGPRSQQLGESLPAIYLFNSIDDYQNALSNWLGEQFDERIDLVILTIEIDHHDPHLKYQPDLYESTYDADLPIQTIINQQIEPGIIEN